MTPLDVDRRQIAAFVETFFKYADPGTYVSLRAFLDKRAGTFRHHAWPTVQINGSLDPIIDAAKDFAGECAAASEPVVFAPPVATFRDPHEAKDANLSNGLTIAVELDARPESAREALEDILGPPTAIIASGGLWSDPETGEIQDKLHIHWRLAKPTQTKIEHDFLKECRRLATRIAGGDPTSITAVHPMRWPGSVHRKDEPRLCRFVAYSPEIEITLADALERLRRAVEKGSGPKPNEHDAGHSSDQPGDSEETGALISAILTASDYHDPIAKLAMRYLLAGMPDGQVVTTLRGIMLGVPAGIRDYKNGLLHKGRWQSRYNDILRAVTTARSKINDSKTPDQNLWPVPVMFDEVEPPPAFPVNFLPGPLASFACDITDRMQCPVDLVAIPLIVAAATVIGKRFRLAPKMNDDWTERPCLWGGLILPSGSMKSPAFQQAMGPLRRLQSQFHAQHEAEIEDYKDKVIRSQYVEKIWKEKCKAAIKKGEEMPERPVDADPPEPPRMRRLLTGDSTQEALVDLIQQNPDGLLLMRDELSAWFKSFNQYRSGAGADRQFFLECHSGGSFIKDRRTETVMIDDLFLNVCGGLQPEVVRTVLTGGDLDGMTARFSLLIWPARYEEFTYIDRRPDQTAAEETEAVFKKLLAFDPAHFFGPDTGAIRALRFDDDAQQIFAEWYTSNQLRLRQPDLLPAMAAQLAKYAGLFARLAIVHHLIRHTLGTAEASPVLVDAIAAAACEEFIDQYLEPHARRIHHHLGNDPVRDNACRIAIWITENPSMLEFTARDIRRKQWAGLTDQEDTEIALDYLENVAGWVRSTPHGTGPKGGRPTVSYQINPLVRGGS